jgi:hypothetical protein
VHRAILWQIGFYSFFVRIALPDNSTKPFLGRDPGGCRSECTGTSCHPQFHCAEWSFAVVSDSPRLFGTAKLMSTGQPSAVSIPSMETPDRRLAARSLTRGKTPPGEYLRQKPNGKAHPTQTLRERGAGRRAMAGLPGIQEHKADRKLRQRRPSRARLLS